MKLSNCSQQIPALSSTIGRHKVEVLAARLRDINPACTVEPYPHPANATTAADILRKFGRDSTSAHQCACREGCPTHCSQRPVLDAVLDCADSIADKVLWVEWCEWVVCDVYMMCI